MGILEAPFYKLPVVNIGRRQRGRLNAGNVEFVGFNRSSIIKALKRASFDNSYRKSVCKLHNPYGNGTASEKILNVLTSINIKDKKWYTKRKLC